jgi:glutamate 5-kinase
MAKKSSYNTIVIKVGSSSLVDKAGSLDPKKLKKLAGEVAKQVKDKKKVVIVTSGAIVCGASHLGISGKLRTIPQKQAAAAVGQSRLMHEYEKAFREFDITVAQVLLTRDAIADRAPYINARNTLTCLLENNVVPIVNENDTVSTDEIKFGDNDKLSALVASLIDADLLLILTNVDGFFLKDEDGRAVIVDEIKEITQDIRQEAGRPSEQGTGGMATKIDAAEIAMSSGTTMVIANSSATDVVSEVVSGASVGTKFIPKATAHESRKRWLAFGLPTKGTITVDGGAETALVKKGGSLLAVGIVKAEGKFDAGDAVRIIDEAGKELARGLVNCSKGEIDRIKGLKTGQISEVLGYKGSPEVIHRDNIVIL